MRIPVYLILSILLFSFNAADAQSRKISISASRQPLVSVLDKIQEASNYTLVFSNEVVSDTILVTFEANRMPVSEILDQILPEKQLYYTLMSNRMIVIGSSQFKDNQQYPASQSITLSGKVIDQKKNPLPFASVGLMQDTGYITGVISDESGSFILSYPFKERSEYILRVSSVGYQPLSLQFVYPDTAGLRNLMLTEDNNTLNTVNITASRPLMERRSDRYIVNVEGGILANGNSGLEVLEKSPGIWVGNDGSIKIKGNQSVMVMINDVVQRMSESDLAEYLRTLRSEDISKIEIISNPPSEFEAAGSGGIIHIILKKARNEGLLGSLSGQYRQQKERPNYGMGLSLDYKLKSLYLFGNVSYGKDESDYIASTTIRYPNQDQYSSNTDRYNNNSRMGYRVGVVYDLAQNQSIGIQTIQTANKLNQFFDTSIDFSSPDNPLTGFAKSEWFRRPEMSGTTLNYALKMDSLGSGLKIIGDYVNSTKTETNNFKSVYTEEQQNSTYRNNTPNTTKLYSAQADFTKVFKHDLQFKSGLKFTSTERDNEVLNEDFIAGEWVLNPDLSNRFIYKENLLMAYASLEKSIKKTSVKLGLRAEETFMKGNSITTDDQFNRKYLGLFPSLFIMRHLNEEKGSSVFFNYSRRLQRPSFADLNPYRLQFDDYLTQLGNPDLLPEYTHKLELGTTFLNGLSADVYYAVTTDKIAQLARPVGDNTIEYQTRNFSSSAEYGFSLNAPLKIFSWWNTNNGLVLYNLAYELDDFKIRQTTFYLRTQHTATLKDLFDLDAWMYYKSPFVSANTHVAHQFIADMGISKRFFEKKTRIRFYVSDIFNTAREKDFTEYTNTRIDFYQKRPTQTFNLSLSYSFSAGKKFSNKKLEQGVEEEKGRIGN